MLRFGLSEDVDVRLEIGGSGFGDNSPTSEIADEPSSASSLFSHHHISLSPTIILIQISCGNV